MMIFPRGEVVHKNLSTVYTDLSALLGTLRLEGFYGAIEIDFPKGRGILFIDNGEVINGEVRSGIDSDRIIGPEAIEALLNFSKQKDGVISIYRLPPEQVALVSKSLTEEALFQNLSTQFIHLDQFLLKLKEEKHTGYIEVMSKEHQPMGVLFLDDGELVEMFTLPKTGPSVFGRMSIPIFIENAAKQGAYFNVYGRKNGAPLSEGILSAQITEDPVIPQNDPPQMEASVISSEEAELKEAELKEAEREEGENSWQDVLSLCEEFLSKAEGLVDHLTSEGTFRKTFKRALIQRAEEFGFLDPFAGEFEYREGVLRFTGTTEKTEFVRGLVECFRTTLFLFEDELPKQKMVPLKLKAGIESFIASHKTALKKHDLESSIASLIK